MKCRSYTRQVQRVVRTMLILLILCEGMKLFAQNPGTPVYYNSNSSTAETSNPLFGSTNRIQCIYGPGKFNTSGINGTPAGRGRISAIYIRIGSVLNVNPVFSDFTIKLSQNAGTRDSFTGTAWNGGMQTVFYRKSIIISGSAGNWIKIPLQDHFVYNPNLSLIFELSVSAGSGLTLKTEPGGKKNNIYGKFTDTSGTGFLSNLLNLGIDIAAVVPDNAGIVKTGAQKIYCSGTNTISINIANNGYKQLDSVRINWILDDTLRPFISYKTLIDTLNSSSGNTRNVVLTSLNIMPNILRKIKVWTSLPNGQSDTFNSDDTQYLMLQAALKGTYRIGPGRSPYSTLGKISSDLNNFGICGTVNLLIDSATFNERFLLNRVEGISSLNRINIRGAGTGKTLIQSKAASFSDWQTVLINGTDYVSIKHVGIKCQDSVLGIGIHLVASSYCEVDSCKIELRTNSWSFKLFGICGSGSVKESLPGFSGNYNSFTNLDISGAYYGIYYVGGASWDHNYDIRVENNTSRDYLRNGIYLQFLSNTLIAGNVIESQRMADVNGVVLSALNNFRCIGNRVYSVREGLYADNCNIYYKKDTARSLMANNVVINTGTYWPAVELKFCKYIDFKHNSLRGRAAVLFRLMNVDSCNVVSNLFKDTVLCIGVVIGSSTFNPPYTIDYNVYYFPGANFPVNYQGTLYNSVGGWFSAISSINSNSLNQDPMYRSYTDLNLIPGNRPTGPYIGIDDDHAGMIRCRNSPTIGAFELIRGSSPDPDNPSFICTGDTFRLALELPQGLSDSDYNKLWEIEKFSIETLYGSKPQSFAIDTPSKTKKGAILLFAMNGDEDSAYFISYMIRDKRWQGCYSRAGVYLMVNRKPQVDFSASPSSVCIGQNIAFLNLSTVSSQTNWLWQFGNGATSAAENPVYKYSSSGEYNVLLTALVPACTLSLEKKVVIGNSSGSRFVKSQPFNGIIRIGSLAQPDIFCGGDTAAYELIPPTGFNNSQYNKLWKFGEIKVSDKKGISFTDTFITQPDSLNNLRLVIIVAPGAGADTLTVTVKVQSLQAIGCDSTFRRYLYIAPRPDALFTNSLSCINSGPVRFTNQSTVGNGNLSYQWDFGNGMKSTQTNPVVLYNDTGNYKLRLIVNSDLGCTDTFEKAVRIFPSPVAYFVINGHCSGDTIKFIDSSFNNGALIASRSWSFGDGTYFTGPDPVHQYTNQGLYQARLKIQSSDGCSDSFSAGVKIYKTPAGVIMVTPVCRGAESSFSIAQIEGSNLRYFWNFGDSSDSEIKHPTHVYQYSGTHPVILLMEDSIGHCENSFKAQAEVHALPDARFSRKVLSARIQRFIPSDSNQALYKWYFGDGDSSNLAVPTHSYPNLDANYTVKLRLISDQACSNEFEDTLHIVKTGINHYPDQTVFQIYPNPASSKILIETSSETSYELINSLGMVCKNGILLRGINTITVAELSSGIYFIKTDQGAYKLIIE